MCDKLDTGLGRIVQTSANDTTGTSACATSGCESSFLYLFMTYAIALVWSSIPYVLVWFGVLESVLNTKNYNKLHVPSMFVVFGTNFPCLL